MIDRAETFIGWRYLFRRRRSRAVLTVTIVMGLVTAALIGSFLYLSAHGSRWSALAGLLGIQALLIFTSVVFLNFFSVFTSISMTGVFWGVSALTVVLSVASGFQQSFQDKVLGVNAHMLCMKYGVDFVEWRDVAKKVEEVPGVKRPVAPFVFNEMMIAHDRALSGVLVKGIQPATSTKVLDIGAWMSEGSVDSVERPQPPKTGGPPLPSILLGKELAKKLRVHEGDVVRLIAPKEMDPSTWSAEGHTPKTRDFRVGGIFYAGFEEYDSHIAFIDLAEAQSFMDNEKAVTGLEWRVDDVYRSKKIAERVDQAIGGSPYRVIDWRELNHNLFTALALQKLVLTIILFLIIVVAMFGVVATMTMLVIDKKSEIAIIKSMGMRSGAVAWTFQVAGMTIAGLGTAAGIGIGLLTCELLQRFAYHLDPHVYLIDRLPVEVHPIEVGIVALVTLTVSFFATLIPSYRAAQLPPVEGLRYE